MGCNLEARHVSHAAQHKPGVPHGVRDQPRHLELRVVSELGAEGAAVVERKGVQGGLELVHHCGVAQRYLCTRCPR